MKTVSFNDLGKCSFNVVHAAAFKQFWKNKSTFSYMQTERPDNGLTLICCDAAVYTLENGAKITAKSGDVICISKNARYEVSFFSKNESTHSTVLLNFLLLDDIGEELFFEHPIKTVYSEADSEIYRKFYSLSDIYGNSLHTGINFKIIMYELIDSILRHTACTYGILKGIEYIDSHIGENIKISNIAAMCAMSESSFRRKFKEHTGVSPVKYITAAKIEKAKQLLSGGELSIDEISASLNFYDTSYFYKIFKNTVGSLPSEFRPHR